MKINLSDSLKPWIEQQADLRGYPSADAFVESILQQTKSRYQQRIDEALLESLASGTPADITPEFWEERQRELERRLKGSDRAAS